MRLASTSVHPDTHRCMAVPDVLRCIVLLYIPPRTARCHPPPHGCVVPVCCCSQSRLPPPVSQSRFFSLVVLTACFVRVRDRVAHPSSHRTRTLWPLPRCRQTPQFSRTAKPQTHHHHRSEPPARKVPAAWSRRIAAMYCTSVNHHQRKKKKKKRPKQEREKG